MGDDFRGLSRIFKQGGKDSSDALKRYSPIRPRLERILDIFDSVVPFNMEFYTKANETTVMLNLYFNEAPPTNCCEANLCAICEFFSDGEEIIQLERGYIEGSVSVFIDGALRTTYVETSPVEGIVTITIAVAVGTVVRICYVYEKV
jgi:hypothetical protein